LGLLSAQPNSVCWGYFALYFVKSTTAVYSRISRNDLGNDLGNGRASALGDNEALLLGLLAAYLVGIPFNILVYHRPGHPQKISEQRAPSFVQVLFYWISPEASVFSALVPFRSVSVLSKSPPPGTLYTFPQHTGFGGAAMCAFTATLCCRDLPHREPGTKQGLSTTFFSLHPR
jgi:hypothetical protein